MKYVALLWLLMLTLGCSATPDEKRDNAGDGGPPAQGDGAIAEMAESALLPPECADASVPPQSLVCTGLFADIAAKDIAGDVHGFTPAVPLWSDGAEKRRWVWLPPDSTIDASDPNEWTFPVGTKFWKEFVREGHRIETRLWQKVRSRFWVSATYAWNAEETEAIRSSGGDLQLPSGAKYHIPTGAECDKCHRGRTDTILGFEQVNLGLAGASGWTLPQLVLEGRLVPPPTSTALTIGDDGTGTAAPALAWLHTNCGITCHNRNSNSTAYGAGMRLRLDATQLDGRSVADFDTLLTTQGISVNAPAWNGRIRIVPGDPETSLLYSLISHRGPNVQMPPIASDLVDESHVAWVEAWIRAMHPRFSSEAGTDAPVDSAPPPDASMNASMDASLEGGGAAEGSDASPGPDAQDDPSDAGSVASGDDAARGEDTARADDAAQGDDAERDGGPPPPDSEVPPSVDDAGDASFGAPTEPADGDDG